MAQTALKRGLSPPLLTLYGLGTTVGAGVYVLIGEVAAGALALGAVAAWGIVESVTLAASITVVEIGGLLLIIVTGAPERGTLPERFF